MTLGSAVRSKELEFVVYIFYYDLILCVVIKYRCVS